MDTQFLQGEVRNGARCKKGTQLAYQHRHETRNYFTRSRGAGPGRPAFL